MITEQVVLEALIKAGKAKSVAEIKADLNCHERNIVEQFLLRLLRAGQVRMSHHGFEAIRHA